MPERVSAHARRTFRLGSEFLLAALLLSGCRAHLDDLTERLRCGMAVEDVRSLARNAGAAGLIEDSRVRLLYGTHQTSRGRARVYFGFERGRLVWFRNGEQRGLTGFITGLKHDLCTGRRFGSLILSARPRWEGAAVLVDGRRIADLPPGPNVFLEIDVPAGEHTLSIARQGFEPFTRAVAFNDENAGRLQVEVE